MEVFGLGLPELVTIALVLLLLFGARKLPELGHSIGRFGKEVKRGLESDDTSKTSSKSDKK